VTSSAIAEANNIYQQHQQQRRDHSVPRSINHSLPLQVRKIKNYKTNFYNLS
jgi:hypothetical protein